jgi:iron complex outermembrane receptor protein
MPLNNSDEGGVNWNSLSLENIEQIEIFKGPGSSLYGSNAMGGVINLISRKPSQKLTGNLTLSYGTYNSFNSSFSVSGSLSKKLSFTLNGFFNLSDGYNNIPDSLRKKPANIYSTARYLKEGGINARAVYTISKHLKVDLNYGYFRDKRGEGTKIEAEDGVYRHFNTNTLRGNLFGTTGNLRYSFCVYFQRENYFNLNEKMKGSAYQRFDARSNRDDVGALINTSWKAGEHNLFTAGLENKIGITDGGDYYQTSPDVVLNKGKLNTLAMYLQDELSLLNNKIHVQAGLRLDRVKFYDGSFLAEGNVVKDFALYNGNLKENIWTALSPRIGLKYAPRELFNCYVSYSTGFRASILDDLTRSGWMWIGPKIANPDLGPEKLDNFEIGLDLKPVDKLKLSSTWFYSVGNNFLYYAATGDSLWHSRPIYRRENVTKVNILGSELCLNYEPNDKIMFSTNYTYNQTKISAFEKRCDLENKELTYSPTHQIKGNIFLKGRLITANLSMLYKGKQYINDDNSLQIGGYFTSAVSLSRSFIQDKVKTIISIHDLFNNQHMETGEYLSQGRLLTVKLTIYLK